MRDDARIENKDAAELARNLADRVAEESGEDDDVDESLAEYQQIWRDGAGHALTPERRQELFDLAREAGVPIRDAGSAVGVGQSRAYEMEGDRWKDSGDRNFTKADKERRVVDYISDHPDASNREVAKATGVSHPTVGSIRDREPVVTPETVLAEDKAYQEAERDATRAGVTAAVTSAFARICDLDPEELALHQPGEAKSREIAWASRVIEWFSSYRDSLETQPSLRLVKG